MPYSLKTSSSPIGLIAPLSLPLLLLLQIVFVQISHGKPTKITNPSIANNSTTKSIQFIQPKRKATWSTSASSYSPALSIHQFVDDWDGQLTKGDYAFAQGRTAIDFQPASSSTNESVKDSTNIFNKKGDSLGYGLGYGLAMRYDYLLKFNEPTADVYWRYKNKQMLDTDKGYPLTIDAKHNQRVGANMFITLPVADNWQIQPRLHLWKGSHAIDGRIMGKLSTLKQAQPITEDSKLHDNIDKADLSLNYHYDKPALKEEKLQWLPKKPDGYGYSFDLAIQGKLTDATYLRVEGYDLLGTMYWRDMPMTRYDFDYDVSGRPPYTLEGQLDTEDYQQDLPWRVESQLTHRLTDDWQLALSSQVNDVSHLHQLSATYQTELPINNQQQPIAISGIVEPQTRSYGLAIDTEYAGLKWLTDDIDTNKAKRGDVQFYLGYQW